MNAPCLWNVKNRYNGAEKIQSLRDFQYKNMPQVEHLTALHYTLREAQPWLVSSY